MVVIAPSNGSEHFAQNGGTIRETFASHSPQRYSPKSTGAEQIVPEGGESSDAIPRKRLGAATVDIFHPAAHNQPRQARDCERHNSNEKILPEPRQDDQLAERDFIERAAGKNPAGVQTDRQPKRASPQSRVGQDPTD